MTLFYKEPIYKGFHSLIEWSVSVMLFVMVFISNSLILSFVLVIGCYLLLLKISPIVYLYQEMVIIKHPFRFLNRVKEVDYKNCISVNDSNGPTVSDRYSIVYLEKKEKKEMYFFIQKKESYTKIMTFLKTKNQEIEVNAKIPRY